MQDLLLFKRRIMCPARCCCHSCYACCWQTDTGTSSSISSGSNTNSNSNSSNTMTHLTTCSSGRPCLPSSSAPHNFQPYIVQYFIYIFPFFLSPFLCLHLSSALPYPSASVESFLRPPAVCFYYTPALASASAAAAPLWPCCSVSCCCSSSCCPAAEWVLLFAFLFTFLFHFSNEL